MSSFYRVLLVFAVAWTAHACSVAPQQDEISGTRPVMIFDDAEGVFEPARGIDRGGPDLVDGLPYQADGPFLIQMSLYNNSIGAGGFQLNIFIGSYVNHGWY